MLIRASRFGLAEQAINTIYLLGEQPDALCGVIIKNFTSKVFSEPSSSTAPPPDTGERLPEAVADTDDVPMPSGETLAPPPVGPAFPVPPTPARDIDMSAPTPVKNVGMSRSSSQGSVPGDNTPAFSLAQLVFVVGHVAIKHIVYLELVEREFKRRKDEKAKGESYSEGRVDLAQRKPLKRQPKRMATTSTPSLETPRTTLATSSARSVKRNCCMASEVCWQCTAR